MAVTGQQVFDMAMTLIDEVSETGNIVIENPGYYKAKALTFLTTLQTELIPLDQSPVIQTDLSQYLLVSDRIALLVLPYGLAAHLLLIDDPNSASFFNDRYEELKRKQQTRSQPITDVYGVNGFNG
ncbi:hypothetical protein LRR81_08700 [Metabacillus sp. GX 13764]|uniref:hypothetical protein n=1 Tax=Metabacillus kandeliae TaxID=2900151 RepID=UPI001E4832F5|nr:hypothetical protein [Metabacillus kandeliae]MCD7034312.1 hypothetical protein [Metabacillus kandeliae]